MPSGTRYSGTMQHDDCRHQYRNAPQRSYTEPNTVHRSFPRVSQRDAPATTERSQAYVLSHRRAVPSAHALKPTFRAIGGLYRAQTLSSLRFEP